MLHGIATSPSGSALCKTPEMACHGQTRYVVIEGLREDTPVQAPQRGGPFILTDQSLPQLLETLNSRTHMAKFIANCFIGVGAAIITYRAIQAALQLRRKRKERYVCLICPKNRCKQH